MDTHTAQTFGCGIRLQNDAQCAGALMLHPDRFGGLARLSVAAGAAAAAYLECAVTAMMIMPQEVLRECAWEGPAREVLVRLCNLFFGDESGGWKYNKNVDHDAFIAACNLSA